MRESARTTQHTKPPAMEWLLARIRNRLKPESWPACISGRDADDAARRHRSPAHSSIGCGRQLRAADTQSTVKSTNVKPPREYTPKTPAVASLPRSLTTARDASILWGPNGDERHHCAVCSHVDHTKHPATSVALSQGGAAQRHPVQQPDVHPARQRATPRAPRRDPREQDNHPKA